MRLTIKAKLAATFVVVIAMSAGSMFVALQNMGKLNDSLGNIVDVRAAQLLKMSDMQTSLESLGSRLRAMIITDDQAAMHDYVEKIAQDLADVKADLEVVKAASDDALISEELPKFEAELARLEATIAPTQELALQATDAAALQISRSEGSDSLGKVEEAMTAIEKTLAARISAGDNSSFAAYQSASGIFMTMTDIFRQQRNVLLASGDPDLQQTWFNDYTTGVKAISDGLPTLQRLLPPSDQGLFNTARSSYEAMVAAMDKAIEMSMRKGDYYAGLKADEAADLRRSADAVLQSMIDRNEKLLDEADTNADVLFSSSMTLLISLLVGSAVIAAVAATWIVVAISRALAAAVRLANSVAAGDLNASASVKSNDEIRDLIDALNTMTGKLRDVVTEVTSAARNVAAGSQEMSATAEQLSQGATEQASSTEEASASMEEMAATIKQSADNASQTEKIARQSAADAIASGEAVNNAVDAMQTIAEKIMVVQEIARQTDLLALNAAVEAARAGEHGRGFAVVASEVRKLAERSQAAAAEISTLSGTTVKAAQSAGEMLAKLVPDIQRTADLVEEISAGSREQNAGAAQINTAIQQLDKVTQQNTSAAEEMSATSEELASQAEQLQQAIGYFRVDDRHHAARAEATAPADSSAVRARPGLREAVMASAPHMSRPAAKTRSSGGFDLDLDDARDDLDAEFSRRGAA